MRRVKLIVTGDLEAEALHESLRRCFPAQRDGDDVVWDTPRKLNGATTHRLTEGNVPHGQMLDLAQAMLDEVGIGKKGQPADLVVVVDDVELANAGQVKVIAQCFRNAIEHKLRKHSGSSASRYRELLREKCSFHLLQPMVESYLFGDVEALAIAGVRAGESMHLAHCDVEQFETTDSAWLPSCQLANAARRAKTPWWAHERHPKHYLEHLAWRNNVIYEETREGKAAFMRLRWSQVPKSGEHAPIIRALFEDIADWFYVPNPIGNGSLSPILYPKKEVDRQGLLLRNL